MAKEISSKKRKDATMNRDVENGKKTKKMKQDVETLTVKKRKASEHTAPIKVKKSKTSKSVLEEDPIDFKKITTKIDQPKSSKKRSKTTVDINDALVVNVTRSNRSKKTEPIASDDDNDSSREDDQTEILLRGFESDGDEEATTTECRLEPGQGVPEAPALSKKEQKRLKRITETDKDEKPGVVYIGRIPHGFYEKEMKAYFEQFGKILRLRLSRNRKTGNSKHYAWIEFQSANVADIVAKTMDNYLLFKHILKVKVVPDEQVPENLFKGANKRFKKVPWNKIQGRKLKEGASEEVWEKRIGKEQKRREDKAEKLRQLGYEFEALPLKPVKGLARHSEEPLRLTEHGEGQTETIEAAESVTEDTSSKSQKKSKKVIADEPIQVGETAIAPAIESESQDEPDEKKVRRRDVSIEKALKKKKSKITLVEKSKSVDETVDGIVKKS